MRANKIKQKWKAGQCVSLGWLSVSRISTIDLIPLNPYFHGTTSRIGAPFCPRSGLP